MSQTVAGLANLIALQQGKKEDLLYISLLKEQIFAFNTVLIQQKLERQTVISPNFIQTIKCVKLKTVYSEECSVDFPNEKILRTVNPIPKPITWKKKSPFVSIYNTMIGNLRTSIPYVNIDNLEFNQYRTFTKDKVVYVYESDYIYIINAIENDYPLDHISIRGVFGNPTDVKKFATDEIKDECGCETCKECSNTEDSCFTETGDYIIDSSLLVGILSFFNGNNNSNQNREESE